MHWKLSLWAMSVFIKDVKCEINWVSKPSAVDEKILIMITRLENVQCFTILSSLSKNFISSKAGDHGSTIDFTSFHFILLVLDHYFFLPGKFGLYNGAAKMQHYIHVRVQVWLLVCSRTITCMCKLFLFDWLDTQVQHMGIIEHTRA